MSFFVELKCLQVWGNFPLISTPIQKFPLNFHVDSRSTYNPNFCVDSLHQQPQSPGIPHRIREILPAGDSCKHVKTNLALPACPRERDKEFEVRMVAEIMMQGGKLRERTEEVGKSHSQV